MIRHILSHTAHDAEHYTDGGQLEREREKEREVRGVRLEGLCSESTFYLELTFSHKI